ncbi:unknown protein [Seminavis robusta]|uniref:Uncharacterized protein n=1 Tax=Seminavis robusta TaxID=568900 RepID=A0A9N8EA08_9STRA|nr:unknown protein [Seminavis robusta]|eukprot:Sro793_g203290.1 n/a (555) ;mRNA; r:42147-44114
MWTGNFLNALLVLALALSPVMGEPRAFRHLASDFRTLADRDLLSGDCLDIDGNAVCIYFDAGTWSCLVEWNGVACDACAMCESGDESPVGYSCELAAQAAGATMCPTDMVNVACTTEGSAQDCFILPYEEGPEDCMDVDGNNICLDFDAETWTCSASWNGVECDACTVCGSGDKMQMAYSCESAAQAAGATSCPSERVNLQCSTTDEIAALGCFILPNEEDPAPPDETFLDPSNPPPPAAEDGSTFLQIPVASVPPEPSLQTKPPEVQTVAPDVPTIRPAQTVLPTTPPSQTAATSVCAVTVANTNETCSQLLKFTTAACDCYNYCNGKLIGCLAFGERSSFSCAGETVAGCTSDQEETAPVTPDKETPTYSPESPVSVTPLMPICQTKYNSMRTCGSKWSAPEVDGCIACYSNILSGVSTCGDAVSACQDIPMECECGDCIEEILAWIECESQLSCPGLRCSGKPQPQAAAEEDDDGGKMVVLIVGIVGIPREEILEGGTPVQVYQKELPVQEAAPQASAPHASAAPARGNHMPMENDLDTNAPSDDDSLFEC